MGSYCYVYLPTLGDVKNMEISKYTCQIVLIDFLMRKIILRFFTYLQKTEFWDELIFYCSFSFSYWFLLGRSLSCVERDRKGSLWRVCFTGQSFCNLILFNPGNQAHTKCLLELKTVLRTSSPLFFSSFISRAFSRTSYLKGRRFWVSFIRNESPLIMI